MFFHKAVGKDAYAYQKEMAMCANPPTILKVPTGCGKTGRGSPHMAVAPSAGGNT